MKTNTSDFVASTLTKREYFAACAMQGLLASSAASFHSGNIAGLSVVMADKLIDFLNRESKQSEQSRQAQNQVIESKT